MYGLNMPVSRIRTKLREEYERHRYVAQLPVVDVLLAQSNMEFQVGDEYLCFSENKVYIISVREEINTSGNQTNISSSLPNFYVTKRQIE